MPPVFYLLSRKRRNLTDEIFQNSSVAATLIIFVFLPLRPIQSPSFVPNGKIYDVG